MSVSVGESPQLKVLNPIGGGAEVNCGVVVVVGTDDDLDDDEFDVSLVACMTPVIIAPTVKRPRKTMRQPLKKPMLFFWGGGGCCCWTMMVGGICGGTARCGAPQYGHAAASVLS